MQLTFFFVRWCRWPAFFKAHICIGTINDGDVAEIRLKTVKQMKSRKTEQQTKGTAEEC